MQTGKMIVNPPDVSVLVTSKDNADKLKRLIASVRIQTHPNIEIILIDDGSTPPHQGFAADTLIRHDHSCGYVRSRNELARLARGRYLFFFDDDVILPGEEFIANSLKILESHPDCGVMAFGELIPGLGENCLQPNAASRRCYVSKYYGWAHLFRADVWRSSGGLCELFDYGYEETEHSIRLLDSGVRMVYDPDLKVIHDVASASKKSELRRNQNFRNGLMAGLMRHHLTTLPRTICSTLSSIYRFNRAAGLSRKRSAFWCFWAVFDVLHKMKKLLRLRKPAGRKTFQLAYRLDHPPFYAPPDYPI